MSLRASEVFELRICSGAMYAGVPMTDCVFVRSLVPSGAVAMPKSSTFRCGA